MDGVAEARVPKPNPRYERPLSDTVGYHCGGLREGRSVGHFKGKPAMSPVAVAPELPAAQTHRHHSRYPKATPGLPSVLGACPERRSAMEVSVWCRCS